MLKRVISKFIGTEYERQLKNLRPLVDRINSFEKQFAELSDDQLKGKTAEFKGRLEKGESLDSLLPEAFASCREASKRRLFMRHYDVQLIGGIALHRGQIAEMKTGEGKTLVATLSIYLNALTGKGAHLITVNDYLAKRDCAWMSEIYHFLNLTTGTIFNSLNDEQRKKAYASDITYGVNNEFGFDYLRDNMKFDIQYYVQRKLNFAIVDECDSILIDEARTPLIISGSSEESTDKYYEINKIIPQLTSEKHFTTEEKTKTAFLTEEGNTFVEKLLGVENLYDYKHISLLHHIYQGLKAYHLYKKDVDYMVKDGEVMIVDEFTGRLLPGRRWSEGLHQAIEAKENLKVRNENQTLASITFQNYFRMYEKLSGMTGTAETEAVEFKKIYNLDVMVIPTNELIRRVDENDVIYKTEVAKYKAIAKDVEGRRKKGQPVLVGTTSIEKSEKLSQKLKGLDIAHNVLNAKNHEREAEIVAQAGRKNAVTIATNMAGRGTDIVLGGNPEFLAKRDILSDSPDYVETLEKLKGQCEAEKKEVLQAGGLCVVGTERHDSRRIDNQLRGRSGRQGDPGASRFYLSLEDNLMRIFNGERIQKIMTTLNVPDDEPLEARMVTRAIEGAQKKVEGYNFDIRKHILEYDDVMNKQRQIIYSKRREILEGKNIERVMLDMLGDVLSYFLDTYADEQKTLKEWDLENLKGVLKKQFGFQLEEEMIKNKTGEQIIERVQKGVKEIYDRKKESLKPHLEDLQKFLMLQNIDSYWKSHLQNVDHLKEGVNLRAFAQKDPLIEYKKETFSLFKEMDLAIKREVIETFLKIQIQESDDIGRNLSFEQTQDLNYSAPELSMSMPQRTKDVESFSSNQMNEREPVYQNRAERRRHQKKTRKKIKFR